MTAAESTLGGAPVPVAYDATHLTSRLAQTSLTGIDSVDRAYARHFMEAGRGVCGVHYGLTAPHILAPSRVAALSAFYERALLDDRDAAEARWRALEGWLIGAAQAPPNAGRENKIDTGRARWLRFRTRLAHDAPKRLPANAVYLNIAQYGLEYPFLLRWLAERPDVKAVFFAHDLLPLDHPQYFRPGYRDIFQRRFDAIERRAAAVLTTSRVVAERIRVEYERKKKPAPPILAAHLPSPLADAGQTTRRGSELPPYFVAIATLEPRKNHALLLEVWRRLNAGVETPPKLVCVGSPGWSRALVADIRAQAAALSSTVALISDLPAPALRTLLANARALVMPSFAEGYGIPVVEALTLGVPVICSDIPVFREVSQGAGTFLPPADPGAWAAAIGELLNPAGHETARRRAAAFRAQDWPGYFATVEAFLATL